MAFPYLISFLIGVALTTLFLAFGARRLLGARFPLFRTLIAGVAAQTAVNSITNGLVRSIKPHGHTASGTILLAVLLSWACGFVIAMALLVLAEAFVPSGSLPRPLDWVRGLRGRMARTRRYWQISRIFVRHGLGSYLRGGGRAAPASASGRTKLAKSLSQALDEGGVTFVKLGQVLSTRRDVLPAEFVTELGRLQDSAAPVPFEEIEQVLVAELGAGVDEVFGSFDRTPMAAASVAQVHAARLKSGAEVIVKVQRPGIGEVVDRDLDIVARLAGTLQSRAAWGRAIGVADLAAGFAAALREELDFGIEMRNMAAVAAAAASRGGESAVVIPTPHEHLCTDRVLVMERLDGIPLSKAGPAITERGLDRDKLAHVLLDTLLRQVMIDGIFHADPHPGNIMLLSDGRLGLLDFGSVGRLDSELRGALQRMLLAMNRGDPVALADSLLEVMARPDELDSQSLERALGAFMARHLGAGMVPDVRMFTDLFRIVARYELAVPPEFAAVFRALATIEGELTQLAPGFDIVTEARTFGQGYLAERLRPDSLRQTATDELTSLLPMLRRLPRRMDRIASAVENGRLSVNVRLLADERDRRTIDGLLQQVLLTVLAATAGIMAVMLLGLHGGPTVTGKVGLYQFFGYGLLVVCSVLALRVLALIFHTGQRE